MKPDNNGDAEVLTKLLREYTESLQTALQGRERLFFRWLVTTLAFSFGWVVVSILFPFITSRLESTGTLISYVVGVIAGFITIAYAISRKYTIPFNESIEVLAHKLDKIARRASQQMEHTKTSFGVELELDLRLTEAEAALHKASRKRKTEYNSQRALEVIEPSMMHDFLTFQRLNTDKWYFSGETGRFIRMIALPELSRIAKDESRHIAIKLQIIDPNNTSVCNQYANYRGGLKSASNDSHDWTGHFVRLQCIATIVSLVIHKELNSFLRNVSISLKESFSPIRIDISANSVILTSEKKGDPCLRCKQGSFLYNMYEDEFLQTFQQRRALSCDLDFKIQSEKVTTQDIKNIATTLKLASGLEENDYNLILESLNEHEKNFYGR